MFGVARWCLPAYRNTRQEKSLKKIKYFKEKVVLLIVWACYPQIGKSRIFNVSIMMDVMYLIN